MDVSERVRTEAREVAPKPVIEQGMTPVDAAYMRGGKEPVTSSILVSNSKFLNSPWYREAWCQAGLRRNGRDLPVTYHMPMVGKALGEVTDFTEFARLIEVEKVKNAKFAEWLTKRHHQTVRADDVARYTTGTLGHAVWTQLTTTDYELDQTKGTPVANDIDFIYRRRAGVHDYEHMVTGFLPNAAGELALNFTNLAVTAHYFSPELAHFINAGFNLVGPAKIHRASLFSPVAMSTMYEAVSLGIQMGRALRRPLLMEPWEEMFDWQITDIVAHLGITPGPGEAWDWTTEATMD